MKKQYWAMAMISLAMLPLIHCGDDFTDLSSIISHSERMQRIESNFEFRFLEGPAWHPQHGLFFTDVPVDIIYRMSPDGQVSIFKEQSLGANGLMVDNNERLIVCESKSGRVTALNWDASLNQVIAEKYNGKRFNSPNDLVIGKNGGIYFTDPVFGEGQDLPQDDQAVYFVDANREVHRVIDDMVKPNGVIVSPDASRLYVVDTYGPLIRGYNISETGLPVDKFIFADLKLFSSDDMVSGADGVTIDQQGNLYVTSRLGIQVFSENGSSLGIIKVPEQPSNCTFGGEDMSTLYITARTHVYKIKLKTKGVQFPVLTDKK